jgi:hypothetical protein
MNGIIICAIICTAMCICCAITSKPDDTKQPKRTVYKYDSDGNVSEVLYEYE